MKIIRRTRAAVIKRWIAALRSGKYKQGAHALRKGDKYCCLGVLCDLAAKDGGQQWENGLYARSSALAPSYMYEWLGFGWALAQGDLTEMNDDGGSFAEIADRIERVAKYRGLI